MPRVDWAGPMQTSENWAPLLKAFLSNRVLFDLYLHGVPCVALPYIRKSPVALGVELEDEDVAPMQRGCVLCVPAVCKQRQRSHARK